jgi:DNA-binding NtrC family response regulator
MVDAGRFRQDLYYRLNVVRIEVPALRERRDDVPLLVHHFLRKHRRTGSAVQGIEPEALELLVRHAWPGNVRELENAVESALALAQGDRLRAADFQLGHARFAGGPGPRDEDELPLSLEAYERCALERSLRESGGDVTQAARCLGIGRSTLYRKLAEHGIGPGRRAPSASFGRTRAIR